MRRIAYVAVLVAGCAGNATTPRDFNLSADQKESVRAAMVQANVPGLAAVFLNDCRITNALYLGVADRESEEAIDAWSAFEAASLSKPVLAWIVMQAVASGEAVLDEKIAERIPYPRIEDQGLYGGLTLRILLSHRAGLPNWSGNASETNRTTSLAIAFAPGTSFSYSGEGYQLAQAYLEEVTGRSLQTGFEAALSGAMPNSVFRGALPDIVSGTFGHDDKGTKREGRAIREWEDANAAFTLRTTVTDYGAFVAKVCRGEGIDASAHAQMLTPQIGLAGDEYGADPAAIEATLSWTLGWGVQDTADRRVYFHWGDNGVFRSFAAFDPTSGRGAVYFANGRGGLDPDLIEAVMQPTVGSMRPAATWLN